MRIISIQGERETASRGGQRRNTQYFRDNYGMYEIEDVDSQADHQDN